MRTPSTTPKADTDRTPTGHKADRRNETKPDGGAHPRAVGGEDARALAILLLAEGLSVAEVARRVGVRRQTVSGWKNHHATEALAVERERRKAGMEDALQDARRELRDATHKAAKVLVTQLESSDPAVALAAAKTLLDRAGLPRVEVVQSETRPLDLSGLTEEELSQFEALLSRVGGGA